MLKQQKASTKMPVFFTNKIAQSHEHLVHTPPPPGIFGGSSDPCPQQMNCSPAHPRCEETESIRTLLSKCKYRGVWGNYARTKCVNMQEILPQRDVCHIELVYPPLFTNGAYGAGNVWLTSQSVKNVSRVQKKSCGRVFFFCGKGV